LERVAGLNQYLTDLDNNYGKSEFTRTEEIYRYYNDKNEEVRWLIGEILFWDHSDKSLKILYKMMKDKNWIVRCEALESLANKNNSQVLNEVFHYIQSNQEDNEIVYTYTIQSFYDIWLNVKGAKSNNTNALLIHIISHWFNLIPFKHTRITGAALLYK
jgi:hypothetical protein